MSDSPACRCVLVVGDLFSLDMRSIERRVEELARDNCDVRVVPNVAEALVKGSTQGLHPDLVIVCQHWPEEYTVAEVRQILGAFPLARLICCYGPWCASDGRTRDVWPLSVRVTADSSPARIDLELEVLADARWPLPLTASRDEIVLFDPDSRIPEAPVR
jgi:hypothetical protein